MKSIIIILAALLAASSLASAAYSTEQQISIEGYRLSFQLGQEYQKVTAQGGSAINYNSLVDQWNAFVTANYGNDTSLLMQKLTGSDANLQKPFVSGSNLSDKGIVHSMEGTPSVTTNDINQMADWAISKYQSTQGRTYGDGYLGGV